MGKNRKLLLLVPAAVGAAALAVLGRAIIGKRTHCSLSGYFGPLTDYDRVTIYRNGKSAMFTERDPAYATVVRLLGELPLCGSKQRFGEERDETGQPRLVVTLEREDDRAAVVFADDNELRLTPPGERWLLLRGDFKAAASALCALADSWCGS